MFFKPNEKVREKRLNKTFLCWLKYQQILFKEKKNAALPVCHVIFEPFQNVTCLVYRYRYGPTFYNWFTAFVKKSANFITLQVGTTISYLLPVFFLLPHQSK